MSNCSELQCCMITFETIVDAKMDSTLGTDVGGSLATIWLVTADDTVTCAFSLLQMMILYQRNGRIRSSACLHCLSIFAEQLHQGVHELFPEIQLSRSVLF